ncbi:tripartite tricarboxylate transporter TctB family protein [Ramlibacter sp. MMS24-I3-19]|uniref:tripartite tricarboxylate transporter TctB family protein n=1 Tax=Ramlibacter sp. MMS24-I3-19 TaxID=3416606 RepID=UPI003D05C42D
MNDRNLLRGLFLSAVALAFGLPAFRYPIGDFSRAGPGLFPLMVSSLLLLIGVISIIRSRFVERHAIDFQWRNIALVIGSLCAFALVSEFVNMIAGIFALVFCASFAGKTPYSVVRNLKIVAGLVLVAFAFQKFLGVNLPLY